MNATLCKVRITCPCCGSDYMIGVEEGTKKHGTCNICGLPWTATENGLTHGTLAVVEDYCKPKYPNGTVVEYNFKDEYVFSGVVVENLSDSDAVVDHANEGSPLNVYEVWVRVTEIEKDSDGSYGKLKIGNVYRCNMYDKNMKEKEG